MVSGNISFVLWCFPFREKTYLVCLKRLHWLGQAHWSQALWTNTKQTAMVYLHCAYKISSLLSYTITATGLDCVMSKISVFPSGGNYLFIWMLPHTATHWWEESLTVSIHFGYTTEYQRWVYEKESPLLSEVSILTRMMEPTKEKIVIKCWIIINVLISANYWL